MSKVMSSPAEKFRKLAATMEKAIENGRRPMTQNPTPKRMKEFSSRVIDADNADRGREALLALADAWDRDDVPVILQDIRTKDEVCRLMRHGTNSTGYYDIHSTGKFTDTSPKGVALQQLFAAHRGDQHAASTAEHDKRRKLERMINELRFVDIPGFFPTPRPICDLMLQQVMIGTGMTVLEPSAGIGSIADAVRDKYPSTPITCCEIRPSLQAILREKGYDVSGDDFATWNGGLAGAQERFFDVILMNPPFEKGQDVEHVRHAYRMLTDSGRLVALMSPSFRFNSAKKFADFREFLEVTGATVDELPQGCFNGIDAFRRTGVNPVMVTIDR